MKRTRGRERNHLPLDRVQAPRISPLALMTSLSAVCIKQIAFQLIFHTSFSNSEVKRSYLRSGETHFVVSGKTELH